MVSTFLLCLISKRGSCWPRPKQRRMVSVVSMREILIRRQRNWAAHKPRCSYGVAAARPTSSNRILVVVYGLPLAV